MPLDRKRFIRPPIETPRKSVPHLNRGLGRQLTAVMGDIEAHGPIKDDGGTERGKLSIATQSYDGLLSSDIKVHAILEKILYEMKLIRLYAQEESGGRELGVTAEELKE